MAANDSLVLQIKTDKAYDDLRIGFLQADNPGAFRRLNSIATLNAARKILPPIKQAAPTGRTTEAPGRLKKNVKARGVRFNKPGAVVGIKRGKNDAWYAWFVTAGRSGRRRTKSGIVGVRAVSPRPFVSDTIKRGGIIQSAMEAYSSTVEKFLNDKPFRQTILRFKRGR